MSRSVNELKALCQEHGYDSLQFWPMSWIKDSAVSLRMKGYDIGGEFDANVVFSMVEHQNNLKKLMDLMLYESKEPIVLIVPSSEKVNQKKFFNSFDFTLIPVRWTDNNDKEYNVYIKDVKGLINMGGYVNMMEHIKEIGNVIVTINRPTLIIIMSFITSEVSRIFRKIAKHICI